MQSLPKKNKAIGVTAFGGGAETLKEVEFDLPELASTEILVENHALSLNPLDTKLRKYGLWLTDKISESTPFVPGCEGVGKIVAIGSDVKNFKEGDLVFYTYQGLYGSAAKYTAVDYRQAAHAPKSLEATETACITTVFGTALETFSEHMGIPFDPSANASKTILIIGGGGGVGSAAIQIAKIAGLTVVATASRPETEKFAWKMGADYVINHKNPFSEELKKFDGEVKGFDYVFNTADMTQDSFKKIGDVLNVFGVVAGIAGFQEPISIGAGFSKRAVVAFGNFSLKARLRQRLETYNQHFENLAKWFDEKRLIPNISITKPFSKEALIEGYNKVEERTMVGKYVLKDVNKYFA